MTKALDPEYFTGRVFNRLTAIKFSHMAKNSVSYWEFLCSCGNTIVISRSSAMRGTSRSCGCLQKEETAQRFTTHGQSNPRNGKRSKTYIVWSGIIARVNHPLSNSYIGVTVSDEWKVFENFLRDMGEVPEGKSIDRIDNTRGYEIDNCRWASRTEQSRNVRKCFTRKTSSKYKGVLFDKSSSKWKSFIRTGVERIKVGVFDTEIEAAMAYNDAAKKYHGDFACLNPI